MQKLLIIGGSGLLGLNWALRKRYQFDTYITLHHKIIHLSGVNTVSVDTSDADVLSVIIDTIKPDLVVNTAGSTNIEKCERQPELSCLSNFSTAEAIATTTAKRLIPLIHVSTDHLFDGNTPFADELAPASPVNTYAKHKTMAEKIVLTHHDKAMIVRTTFFGWGPIYRRSFSDRILDALNNNEQLFMFDDVFFTPLDTSTLIDLAHQVIEKNHHGLINLCSKQRISKYDFSVKLAEAFGFDSWNIQPVQASRVKNTVKRPFDLSLSDKKFTGLLGIDGISIDTTLASLKRDYVNTSEIKRVGRVIPYGKHHVDHQDVAAVVSTLKSDWLTQGPAITTFEKNIADYVEAKYAVAASSATAGLHLAYTALGLQPEDKVLTSPITFVSTANAAYFCNAKVDFADISPATINISLQEIMRVLEQDNSIKIVVPVLYGGSADGMPEISKLAKSFNKLIVEDAAHGLGGSYKCGAKIGSCKYSDCTVFSLHPVKSIAAGEGGVITTNDEEIYKSLLRLRSHGINKGDDKFQLKSQAYTEGTPNLWYYEMSKLGYHYRITDIQAALANSQLNKLDAFVNRRRDLAHQYVEWINQRDWIDQAQNIDIDLSANHLFTAEIDYESVGKTRNDVMSYLRQRGILTQVHYIPVVNQPFFQHLGFNPQNYPVSQNYYSKTLSLPLYYGLSDEDFRWVLSIFDQILAN